MRTLHCLAKFILPLRGNSGIGVKRTSRMSVNGAIDPNGTPLAGNLKVD
jgi:hypothetical protein